MACLAARVHMLCRRESKFAKPCDKRNEMLYRDGTGAQDIFENFPKAEWMMFIDKLYEH